MATKLLFEAIVGSQSYGTATPTSDEDRKFVFIQHPNDILGFKYQPQQEINKEYIWGTLQVILNLMGKLYGLLF